MLSECLSSRYNRKTSCPGVLCRAFFLAFLCASAATGQAVATEITGAGSSFAAPVYQAWSVPVEAQTRLRVNYQSVGSSAGQDQVIAHTVDFGASDKPMTVQGLKKAHLYQFPSVMSGVVVIVNLPSVPDGALRLDGLTLAGIFQGRITSWNDPAIAAMNPGVKLPDDTIAVVHRADGSGTSYVFTSYLSRLSPQWKEEIGAGTLVGWPGGAGARGNDGVAALVRQTEGSIGYVEYAFAAQNHMNIALLRNHDGAFVAPSLPGFMAAAKAASWQESAGYAVDLLDQPGDGSWPIVTPTYVLVPEGRVQTAEGKGVHDFFAWGFAHGADLESRLGYVGLPSEVQTDIMKSWPSSSGALQPSRP